MGLIYGIASLGIPAYGVYRIAQLQAKGSSKRFSYWSMLAQHTLFATIGFGLFYLFFSKHENWSFIKPLFPLGACYLIANSLSADWYLQGREQFKRIALRNFLFRTAGLVAILLWIDSPAAYSTYYWIMVITVILTAVYNLFWIQKDLKTDRNRPADTRINWKEMLLFFIATVFISITDYLDATMLGLLSREAEVGFYTNAAKLVRLSLLVTLALNAVVFPQFSRIQATANPGQSDQLLHKSIDWLIFLTIPVSLLYLLFGKELVLTFSGSGFTNSIPAVHWMAPIPLFISLSNLLLYYGLSSRPKLQKRIALGVVVGILISLGMNSWLIPRYGALGAAMNSLLTEFLFLTYFLVLIKPTLPYASIGKAVLAALIFIPVYWMMVATEWSSLSILLIGSGSCLILYAAVQHFIWKHGFVHELQDMFTRSKKGITKG